MQRILGFCRFPLNTKRERAVCMTAGILLPCAGATLFLNSSLCPTRESIVTHLSDIKSCMDGTWLIQDKETKQLVSNCVEKKRLAKLRGDLNCLGLIGVSSPLLVILGADTVREGFTLYKDAWKQTRCHLVTLKSTSATVKLSAGLATALVAGYIGWELIPFIPKTLNDYKELKRKEYKKVSQKINHFELFNSRFFLLCAPSVRLQHK